ncbi:carbon-nitrogen hydrolase family protein [Microbacterium sp. NPDC076911]|uniref:carbon-nitrogen hydrolase family protein n=1 Tax=Microbacterium sp. NPDC076911 TaxID=3154958 RepID=UPI00342E47F1
MASAKPDSFAIAIAQPIVRTDPDHSANVSHAVTLIERAAACGADLVLFPEHSPGPFREGQNYDASKALADAAIAHHINVVWSRMEECADDLWRLVVYVVGRDGSTVFRYERTHPATVPSADTGGFVAPGSELGSFEIEGIPIGIAVCSELWIPETTRVLALRGAEIILSPAGGHFTALTKNWQVLARARAIENHCYVALTNNVYGAEQGAAMIAGPEHVLVEAGRAELAVATVDLKRARWLRDTDDSLAEPKPFDSIPGLLRARRPALYDELVSARDDDFDYDGNR